MTSRQKQNKLLEYIDWGGYPEVVLAQHTERKEFLLKQYFDDILFKDIALRHQVRDLSTLKNIAVFMLTQSASLISYNRIANIFGVSIDLARHYCGYIEEAYLICSLHVFTLKTAQRNRHPKKVHAIDTGLRNAVCMSHSQDRGRVLESLIVSYVLQQPNDGVYYMKNGGEIDIAIRHGNNITKLIQVTQELKTKQIYDRELRAFQKLGQEYLQAQKLVITYDKKIKFDMPKDVKFVSAQEFLLPKVD